MNVKNLYLGFTLIELMMVLAIVAIVSSFSFHFGQETRKQANLLSKKADAFRYQEAFINYFQAYERFPETFPIDCWFNLSDNAALFIDTLSGQIKTHDNPEGIAFGDFTAEELLQKNIPSIQFFLRKNVPIKSAVPPNFKISEVYGNEVLFYLN